MTSPSSWFIEVTPMSVTRGLMRLKASTHPPRHGVTDLFLNRYNCLRYESNVARVVWHNFFTQVCCCWNWGIYFFMKFSHYFKWFIDLDIVVNRKCLFVLITLLCRKCVKDLLTRALRRCAWRQPWRKASRIQWHIASSSQRITALAISGE